MLYQVARGLREQDLSTMSGTHDAGSAMHVQTHVALGRTLRLASVKSHANAHAYPFRPGMAGQGPLGGDCRYHCIGSASKGEKERIALGVDLVAVMLVERCTHQTPALG